MSTIRLMTLPTMASMLRPRSVIADADTEYGSPLHVVRTVRAYERAGAPAIHLEDQAFPKRCGHLDDGQLIGAPVEHDCLAGDGQCLLRAALAAEGGAGGGQDAGEVSAVVTNCLFRTLTFHHR
jgi:hypothetical protein